MLVLRNASLLLASALIFSACGDDGGGEGQDAQLKDRGTAGDGGVTQDGGGGPTDGGGGPTDGGGGPTDGGGGPTDGGGGTCDPVTGGGCAQGETCRFTPNVGEQCRMPIGGPIDFAGDCTGMTDACNPGLNCLDTGNGALCAKLCNPGNDADCAGLPAMGAPDGWTCATLQGLPYGLCTPQLATCDPLNDTCPMGEYCELTANGPGCVPEGASMALRAGLAAGLKIVLAGGHRRPRRTRCSLRGL